VAKVKTHRTQVGKLSKIIRVTTDDPEASRLILRLKGTIVTPVEVLPQPRLWLAAVAGQTAQGYLVLRRHDGKPLHIESLDVNDPDLIEAKFTKIKKTKKIKGLTAHSGDVLLEVSLKPQKDTVSRTTRVNVHTDVPEEPLVNIPVSVRLRPRVEAMPPQVQIALPVQGGKGAHRQLHIRDNIGAKFRVLKVTSNRPEYFTADILSREPSPDQLIVVRVTDEAAAKELSTRVYGKLVVTTDNPERIPKRRPMPPGRSRTIRGRVAPTPVGGTAHHPRPGEEKPVAKPTGTTTPTPQAK